MLVGDAPGEEDDKSGEPFVGNAGRLLNGILSEFNLERDEVYLTNAVKCKPYKRSPKREEIQACNSYLIEEINLVQPKLIICLGASAIKAITGDYRTSVGAGRIKKWRFKNSSVRATYHPTSVSHTPYFLKLIYDDFARFLGVKIGNKKVRTRELIPPKFLRNELRQYVKRKDIAIDIETNQLDPFLKGARIWTIGFCNEPGKSKVVVIHHTEKRNPDPEGSVRIINEMLLTNKKVRLIGHNIKFDLKWFCVLFKCVIKCKIFDTMIALHLLDENYPNKSLKHLVHLHTDMGDYAKEIQDMRKMKDKYPDMQFPLDEMVNYNGDDCDATLRLCRVFEKKLEEEGLMRQMAFNMMALKTLMKTEINGIKVDTHRLNALTKKYQRKLCSAEYKIKRIIGDVNPNSGKQLAVALYDNLEYPVFKHTPKGMRSTDVDCLTQLKRSDRPVVSAILDLRKINKILKTYLIGMEARITSGDKIHTNFRLSSSQEADDRGEKGGAKTGRISSDMQQIPKVGGIKSMFISRFVNGLILQADYSQIELRILAHYAKDKAMLQAFQSESGDIHTEVAAIVYGKPAKDITKLERSATKTINFGVIYGMGPKPLSEQIGTSYRQAERFMNNWFDRFRGAKNWITSQQRLVLKSGVVTTLFGRKRRLIGASRSTGVGRAIIRQGVNAPIQGTASELTLFIMCLLDRYLARHQYRSKIVLTVHDSILFDVYPGERVRLQKVIKRISENPPLEKYFGIKLLVPLKMDIKYGKTWEEADPYD